MILRALTVGWLASGGLLALGWATAVKAGEAGAVAVPWRSLFDGQTLGGWVQAGFEGEGAARLVVPFEGGSGVIMIERGTTLSGVTWARSGPPARINYEIALEAMRLEGGDFFCGLTFPVGPAACTLVVGGWGGTVVGISSVDRVDAAQNETTTEMEFQDRRWYRIRVRVTDAKIEAWIDDVKKVDLTVAGRRLSLRPGDIQKSLPLGIASYMTRAAVRGMRWRPLGAGG